MSTILLFTMIYYLDDVNPNYLSIYMLCGGLLIKYNQDKKSVKVCQRSILKKRFFSLLIFIYDAILYVKDFFTFKSPKNVL